jgi:zinc D-Ala-D-Ala carboxypeptidase
MTQLTPHFSLEEFVESQTAVRNNINNNPSQAIKNNLVTLAQGLEQVRSLLNAPLRISSGYRCMELNRKIGGATDSAHLDGYAADFTCAEFGTPTEVASAIVKSGIKFDQVIEEGTWVHLSFDPKMRQQYLKATFINGQAHYVQIHS